MTCDELQSLLPDHWTGALVPAVRAEVESHLAACDACRDEARTLGTLWQKLDIFRNDAPSADLQARFDTMLAAWRVGSESGRAAALGPRPSRLHATPWMTALLGAAAVLLLVAGFGAGRALPSAHTTGELTGLREEVRSMREIVTLSLLQQLSPSERLRGVTWSHRIDNPGAPVLGALLDTLQHDVNVNVRLAAIDALRQFAQADQVRAGLVDAIGRQSSPLVQIELIDALVELREGRSRDALRALAARDDVDGAVRERARWGLTQIG